MSKKPRASQLRKSQLRELARATLQLQGENIKEVTGAGIISGARLEVRRPGGGPPRLVAVRVTLDREVGLTRHPDGRWVTVPKVDEVIVVAPANESADEVEVLSFCPRVLIEQFDKALAAASPGTSPKAPIFLSLDEVKWGRPQYLGGLGERARWRRLVPIQSIPPTDKKPMSGSATPHDGIREFLERVHREYAALNGVGVEDVTVEFRVTLKARPKP